MKVTTACCTFLVLCVAASPFALVAPGQDFDYGFDELQEEEEGSHVAGHDRDTGRLLCPVAAHPYPDTFVDPVRPDPDSEVDHLHLYMQDLDHDYHGERDGRSHLEVWAAGYRMNVLRLDTMEYTCRHSAPDLFVQEEALLMVEVALCLVCPHGRGY